MEWKPIETAPQDGTWMLLYFAGPHYYKIAFWSEQSADWYDWQGAQGVSASLTAYGDRPTHWMLLPEPPAGLGQPDSLSGEGEARPEDDAAE
jgi:hypothetical protein